MVRRAEEHLERSHLRQVAATQSYCLNWILKAGLHDSDPERVLDSIRMLGNMKTLRSTAELKTLLDAPDLLINTYVWQALLRLKDYSVLPAVAEFFAAQPEAPRELFLPRDRLFAMQDELVGEVGTIRGLDALPYLERLAEYRTNGSCVWKLCKLCDRLDSLRTAPLFSSGNWMIPTLTTVFLLCKDYSRCVPLIAGLSGCRRGISSVRSPQFYAAKTREWWRAEGGEKRTALPGQQLRECALLPACLLGRGVYKTNLRRRHEVFKLGH